jgi:hypothetical protein
MKIETQTSQKKQKIKEREDAHRSNKKKNNMQKKTRT